MREKIQGRKEEENRTGKEGNGRVLITRKKIKWKNREDREKPV